LPRRICPKCQAAFDTDATHCPADGRKLLTVKDAVEERVGTTIDGRYTLLEVVGRGGMGSVYRAMQHSMERQVAVKLLTREISADEKLVKRFLQEARAAAALNHPGIITLHDFGQSESGELYLAMELLEGRDLAQLLHDEGSLTVERTMRLVNQLLDALEHAHERGIVHRDLKPENVFVSTDSRGREHVRVLDFGIAKLRQFDGAESLTGAGMVCGTPMYMSPEQAKDEEVDGRSDIYSVGVLMYEMLSGRPPFDGDSSMQIMLAHCKKPVPPLHLEAPWVRLELAEAIEWGLAKAPDHRPVDAHEFRMALDGAIEATRVVHVTSPYVGTVIEDQIEAKPAATPSLTFEIERAAVIRHSGWRWVATAAIVVVAVTGLWWALSSTAPQARTRSAVDTFELAPFDQPSTPAPARVALPEPSTAPRKPIVQPPPVPVARPELPKPEARTAEDAVQAEPRSLESEAPEPQQPKVTPRKRRRRPVRRRPTRPRPQKSTVPVW